MSLLYFLCSRLFGNVVEKILIPDVQKVRSIILLIYQNVLDCEQSHFSSSVTVSVTASVTASVITSVLFSVVQWSFVMYSYSDTNNNAYADGPVSGVFIVLCSYPFSYFIIIHLPFFLTCRYLGQLRRGSALLE